MAVYRVQGPDGAIHRFEGPDDATPEQVTQEAERQFGGLQDSAGIPAGAKTAFVESLANSIPFGQRITSGLGALGASAMGAGNVGELYDQAQANTQATAEANPKAAMAGTVAGLVPTLALGGGAFKFANKPILSGGGTLSSVGNTLGRMVKGAAVSAPIGAAYSAGSAKTIEDMPKEAISGAKLSAAIGAGTPVLGAAIGGFSNVGKGIVARSSDKIEASGSAMLKSAGNLYDQMRKAGAVLNKDASTGLSAKVDDAVNQLEFIPELNPKTTAIIKRIREKAESGEIGLNEIDQYRRMLGRIGQTEDGVSAGAARRAIDNVVNNLDGSHLVSGEANAINLLNAGRAQYRQAARFDDVADILKKADGDPNRIKAGLTRFLNNEQNTAGWTAAELAALKEAAQSTTGEKLLKMMGKFGFDLGTSLTPGNTVAPLVGGAIAGGSSLGAGIAVPIVGTAARQTQKYIARGKAETLLKTLEGDLFKKSKAKFDATKGKK